MAQKVFNTSVVLSAVDRMTTIVNKAFGNAQQKLLAFQKRADKIAKSSERVAKTTAAIGIASAAPLAYIGKKAIDFEESMADVSKTMGLQRGSAELNKMATEAQKLGIHLGKMPNEAAQMIASLSQGGIKKDLLGVSRFSGEMAVAFDIMADSAGSSFAKTKNALGATTEETYNVMNAINHLSDNTASKASQILTFMASGGAAAANALKITGQESAALGAFFVSIGKSGSEAATIVARMTKQLVKNGEAGKLFRKNGGGIDGIKAVLEHGKKLGGIKSSAFFQGFGEYGPAIKQAADNMELLNESTAHVSDSSKFANSVANEFANRSNTRAFEIAKTKAQLEVTAIKLGNALLPVVSQLTAIFSPMLEKLDIWIDKNPKLIEQLVKGVAIFSAANFAISGLSTVVFVGAKSFSFLAGALSKASGLFRIITLLIAKPTLLISKLSGVVRILAMGFGFLGKSIMWAGRALLMNPIGLAVTGISVSALLIYKYWKPIKAFFINVFSGIETALASVTLYFRGLGATFKIAGANIISSIWEGMKSMASKPVEAMKNMVKKMRDYLPFSPAKIGPFKDLHRVKIVETIAGAINPSAAVSAMKQTVQGVASLNLSSSGSSSQSGTIVLNFSPTININNGSGGGRGEVEHGWQAVKQDFLQMINEAIRQKERTAF